MRTIALGLSLAGLTLLAFSGCSGGAAAPPGVIVTGKLVVNGQPVKLNINLSDLPPGSEDIGETITVEFESVETVDGVPQRFAAALDKTGAFRMDGPGNGIPPGKYKVGVSFNEIEFMEDPALKKILDTYPASNSPKIIDVPESKMNGEHDLGTVDLAKK